MSKKRPRPHNKEKEEKELHAPIETKITSRATKEKIHPSKFIPFLHDCITVSNRIGLHELFLSGIDDLSIQDLNNLMALKNELIKSRIRKLSIIGCKFDMIGIQFLKDTYQNMIHIDLSSNNLGSSGTKHLANGLKNSSSILKLKLRNNQICDMYIQRFEICGTLDLSGLQSLLDSLLTCHQLQYVDISSNYLGGFKIDTTHMKMNNSSTKTSHSTTTLQQTATHLNYGKIVIDMIASFLSQNTSVMDLNLSTNGFEDSEAYASFLLQYVEGNHHAQSITRDVTESITINSNNSSSSSSSSSHCWKDNSYNGNDDNNIMIASASAATVAVRCQSVCGRTEKKVSSRNTINGIMMPVPTTTNNTTINSTNTLQTTLSTPSYHNNTATKSVNNYQNMSIFDFRGSNLTSFSGRFLGHEIKNETVPFVLNLSNNVEFGDEGMNNFAHHLSIHNHVDYHHITGFHSSSSSSSSSSLLQQQHYHNHHHYHHSQPTVYLKELLIRHINLTSCFALQQLLHLPSLTYLTVLDLSDNPYLTDTELIPLLEALENRTVTQDTGNSSSSSSSSSNSSSRSNNNINNNKQKISNTVDVNICNNCINAAAVIMPINKQQDDDHQQQDQLKMLATNETVTKTTVPKSSDDYLDDLMEHLGEKDEINDKNNNNHNNTHNNTHNNNNNNNNTTTGIPQSDTVLMMMNDDDDTLTNDYTMNNTNMNDNMTVTEVDDNSGILLSRETKRAKKNLANDMNEIPPGSSSSGNNSNNNSTTTDTNSSSSSSSSTNTTPVAATAPVSVSSGCRLRSLILQNVGLTAACGSAVRQMLENNNSLWELDLSHNKLIGDEGIMVIISGLLLNTTLKKLRLAEIGMTASGPIAIAATLSASHCPLRALDISNNKKICGSRAQLTFDPAPIFAIMDSIRERYWSHQMLVNQLKQEENLIEIQRLKDEQRRIKRRGRGGNDDDDVVDLQNELLKQREIEKQLQTNNHIIVNDDEMNRFAAARQPSHPTLQLPQLPSISSSSSSAAAAAAVSENISNALEKEKKQKRQRQELKETVMETFHHQRSQRMLDNSHGIQKLNFSNTDIGARACKRVIDTCLTVTYLHSLNLKNCNLSEHGAAHLGEALPRLTGLRWLNISECAFGPTGCLRFFEGLCLNKSLLWVDISKNQLTGYPMAEQQGDQTIAFVKESVTSICKALSLNTTIQYLSLESNGLFGMSSPPYALPVLNLSVLEQLTAALKTNGQLNGALRCLNLLGNHMPLVNPAAPQVNDPAITVVLKAFVSVFRSHPSLSSIAGNLYPALLKRDYGQKYSYPEFHHHHHHHHCPAPSHSGSGSSSSSSGGAKSNNVNSTHREVIELRAEHYAYDDELDGNAHSTFHHTMSNDFTVLNTTTDITTNTTSSSTMNDDNTMDSIVPNGGYILDLVSWTGDWGLVGVLIFEEIRYNHYLTEVHMLNPTCALTMSKALIDNITIHKFKCPSKSIHMKAIREEKIKSYVFRISLAVFLKGVGQRKRVQMSTIRNVLEYCIGCGPLVAQLMEKYAI